MKTGGEDYVIDIAFHYMLDSPGIISCWGEIAHAIKALLLGPRSLMYNGC